MTPFCAADIRSDEGCELVAYQDELGIWTIGVGHAHVAKDTRWTQEQADAVFASDRANVEAGLDRRAPWWRTLSDPRQDVLANMAFELGVGGLLGFKDTLAAVRAGEFDAAYNHMLASKWDGQVPKRAKRLAEQMKTGLRVAP